MCPSHTYLECDQDQLTAHLAKDGQAAAGADDVRLLPANAAQLPHHLPRHLVLYARQGDASVRLSLSHEHFFRRSGLKQCAGILLEDSRCTRKQPEVSSTPFLQPCLSAGLLQKVVAVQSLASICARCDVYCHGTFVRTATAADPVAF